MKILIIGSGGREHAIVDALTHSSQVTKIFAAPGNGGIQAQATMAPIAADDIQTLMGFARDNRVDLTFVGPEVPLSLGVVDLFRDAGLRIVGPTADQARLESSKTYAKNFFKTHGIPTAAFAECATPHEASRILDTGAYPLVIKADGLAGGKGVIIVQNESEARAAVHDLMEQKVLGDAGTKLVIEEFLTGYEVSFHVFAQGATFQPMVPSQDHKRRFDGDVGPNTGGMGAYSSDAILAPSERDEIIQKIIQPTLAGAKTYSGVLYAGLMMTAQGPKIIEYNCRMGDPETQVVLPRLKTDLADVLLDLAENRLSSRTLEWSADVTASVVLVSRGYPGRVEGGKEIHGLAEAARLEGVKIFHAGTRAQDGKVYTNGGRVLNVTARGDTLDAALERAYAAAGMIDFDGKDYRRDIGRKGFAKNK